MCICQWSWRIYTHSSERNDQVRKLLFCDRFIFNLLLIFFVNTSFMNVSLRLPYKCIFDSNDCIPRNWLPNCKDEIRRNTSTCQSLFSPHNFHSFWKEQKHPQEWYDWCYPKPQTNLHHMEWKFLAYRHQKLMKKEKKKNNFFPSSFFFSDFLHDCSLHLSLRSKRMLPWFCLIEF